MLAVLVSPITMVWPPLLMLRLVLLAVSVGGANYAEEWRALPEELTDAAVARVTAAQLRAVKLCYAIEERTGFATPGKALLGLRIAPSGEVEDAVLDGAGVTPRLDACVRARALGWRFPRVRHGPKRAVFPIVFFGDERLR
jgi:hypothetical protein